ncbi:MAG: protein kinase [Polyangiaceae bacterium]|nr:protein kinase [Polyangiaceae bacterium]
MDILPGTIVANRYRITGQLGRGGMGEVFAAENTRTGRPVAIKLLHADAKTKASSVERFRREARASGSINSDYVTQVLDVDDDPNYGIVLVFELLEGESLIDRLKRTGPIPFDELHAIIEQVWMGLADAHRVGIIHRDLKPSNVFLERRPDGSTRVKILDFGISKLPKTMEGETLTEMGQSLGTFSFMPPEQIGKAKTVDHRADIYACTTLIYQSLTGQLPYIAKNVLVMVEQKAKMPPRTVAEALEEPVDPRLEAFMAKGLARDVNERFQSAGEALAAWRELMQRTSNPMRASAAPAPQPPPVWSQSSSSAPLVRPPPPVDISTRNDQRPMGPPIYNEATTDDVVATVAMPRARLLPTAPAATNPAPTTPPATSYAPRENLAATIAMPITSGPAGGYAGASGSGTYGVAQPPTNTPVPYAHPSAAQPGYANPPQAQGVGGYPQQGWPGNAPPNSGQWRQQTGPSMPAAVEPTAVELPQKRPIPFLFWGILAALLGFAIVGVVLYLTRS